MTSRIHRLDSCTIDKIAAGEVIDVPASCVKELIDNAIDAQATDILIEIRLGGRELIKVVDNGCGMTKEEVCLCIERHSTSKLQKIEDLEQISTHGFRGEALASIVAISHTTITSAKKEKDATLQPATTLRAEGGKIVSIHDTQAFPGTTVEVTSLFYNVPARRKFLKSPSKDTQDILKVVTALALASPHISFRLVVDGQQTFAVAEERLLLGRIRALFGEPFRQNAYEVFYSREGFTLSGLVAAPTHMRSSRSGQHLIVNGRPVHSLPISYAVKTAYGTTCEQGKHPLFALVLQLDPASIDVNVHPQKREVRFADEEWVRMLVQEAVSEALFGKKAFIENPTTISPHLASTNIERSSISLWRPFETSVQPTLAIPTELPSTPLSETQLAVIGDIVILQPQQTELGGSPIAHDALVALDMKQAMRSVLFLELEQIQEAATTELLLTPVTIECSAQESALLHSKLHMLERLGFVIRQFGPQNFLVEGVPASSSDLDIKSFVFDLIHDEEHSKTLGGNTSRHLANMYVASMKSLRPPVSVQTAQVVVKRWADHNFPRLAPDGSSCFAQITASSLKDWIAKGGNREEDDGP